MVTKKKVVVGAKAMVDASVIVNRINYLEKTMPYSDPVGCREQQAIVKELKSLVL